MNQLPVGNGKMSVLIRQMYSMINENYATRTPGMLTSIRPTGTTRRPVLGVNNSSSGSGGNLPRYR